MNSSVWRSTAQTALCVFLWTTISQAGEPVAPSQAILEGAWQRLGSEEMLRIAESRVLRKTSGRWEVQKLLSLEHDRLVVRSGGFVKRLNVTVRGDRLELKDGSEVRQYQRLAEAPLELDLKPAPLGRVADLSAQQVEAIQADLAARDAKDQEARKREPAAESEIEVTTSDNTRALRMLVQDVGWIDVARFGRQTSARAVLLAQHSGDLPLMMAALPFVEKDFKSRDDAQLYAVYWDALQVRLGEKQRYGTQVATDANGAPVLVPLEDPERVDEFRFSLGMVPLSDYLSLLSKYLHGGKEVRRPSPAE